MKAIPGASGLPRSAQVLSAARAEAGWGAPMAWAGFF